MKASKILENKLLTYSFLLFILFDFITKILVIYKSEYFFFRYGALIKGCFIITVIFICMLDPERRKAFFNSVFLKLAIILSILFIFSQTSIYNKISNEDFRFNLNYFFRSIYPLVFAAIFLIGSNKNIIHKYVNIFQLLIVLNSFLILFSLFFEFKLLKTYYGSLRFGYQGILLTHSESGYIYFIALGLGYYLYKKFNKKKDLFFILLVAFSMLLIGTKKALFLLVFFALSIIYEHRKSIKLKIYLSVFFVGSFMLLRLSFFNEILMDKFKVFIDVYQKYDFLTALFSFRNRTLTERAVPFIENYWSYMNILFGGPVFRIFRVEMEVFDVFIFFGVLGVIVYIFLFKLIIKQFFSKEGIIMTTGILLATCLSGNFFASINVFLLYLFFIRYYHHP